MDSSYLAVHGPPGTARYDESKSVSAEAMSATVSALRGSADTVADIASALTDLDSSYLAVHGPPGTGKTHTAARVIVRLVAEHRQV
ncbi:hypothetical protein MAHJHV60_47140 [Mycobacterium avium subsp. hominissuis]